MYSSDDMLDILSIFQSPQPLSLVLGFPGFCFLRSGLGWSLPRRWSGWCTYPHNHLNPLKRHTDHENVLHILLSPLMSHPRRGSLRGFRVENNTVTESASWAAVGAPRSQVAFGSWSSLAAHLTLRPAHGKNPKHAPSHLEWEQKRTKARLSSFVLT